MSASGKTAWKSRQEAIKGVPAAWVRCELHKVSAKAKLTELELVETDAAGAITVKIRAVVWQGRWRRIADAFATAGLSLEAGSRVLVHVRARLQPGFGFTLPYTALGIWGMSIGIASA